MASRREQGIGVGAATGVSRSRRATWAEIDLDAVAHNVRYFAALTGAGVMAVVKGNAYGHGAVMVARAAVAAGARWLAVATVDEGLQLRAAGLTAPILVLAPSQPAEAPAAVAAGLTLAVGDLEGAAAVAAAAREAPATVQVEIDTGMHRFGIWHEAAVETIARMAALPGLRIGGVYTHYATADEADRTFFGKQGARFVAVVDALSAAGIDVPVIHQDNSAAALRAARGGDPYRDLVRIGIALYGLSPSDDVPAPTDLWPVLALRTQVARVMTLRPGDSVSYGRRFIADRPLRAALTPIGYADGYRRALSGKGQMLLGGRRAAVLGRVCMDQTVIAVPDGVETRIGDDVTVIGAQGSDRVTVEELAALAETIPYEIGTGLSARLPRRYLRGGRVVATEELGGIVTSDE